MSDEAETTEGGRRFDPSLVRLDEKLVILNLRASHREEVIRELANLLHEFGAVRAPYAEAVCERERRYPTGLPTAGVYVAIPHADATHVDFAAIAVATCKPPVPFGNMANPEQELPVELVIMAALPDGAGQVLMLKRLADAFGEPETLLALRDAETAEGCLRLLKERVLAADDH